MSKCNKTSKIIGISILSLVAAIVLACGICLFFLLDCYPANVDAIDAFASEHEVDYKTKGAYTVFEPEEATVGFIFYPGAKVEHEAYLPLMEACADKGVLCVLVEMPLYFPLIAPNAADGIIEQYPQITDWYIGGHSLGGLTAASYLKSHENEFRGLILLASYSNTDLSDTDLRVLSVYGSNDQIMNFERYKEAISLLPKNYEEIEINGGCHAYFGMYDGQDGNAAHGITNEEQIYQTAELICAFMDLLDN